MHILRLHIENFKGISSLELHLRSRLNLFVGMNGSGKSSILVAIGKLLSWYIRRLSSPQGQGNGLLIQEDEIRNGETCSSIGLDMENQGKAYSWSLFQGRRGYEIVTGRSDLSSLNKLVKTTRENVSACGLTDIPVFVFYQVHRAVLDIPLRIRTHHHFQPLDAYKNALSGSADFRLFFEWFREQEDLENEQKVSAAAAGKTMPSSLMLENVRKALELFLPSFSNWHIQRSPLHFVVEKDGKKLYIEQLSDGEKCLIALVGDLARRIIMANEHSPDPLRYGTGIAMIDEVELHLHPQWQKELLPKLLRIFPGIQFVVTTHSSYVLSQLNSLLLTNKRNGQDDIAIFDMGHDGKSLIDEESGYILPSSMDDAADAIEQELEQLLSEELSK